MAGVLCKYPFESNISSCATYHFAQLPKNRPGHETEPGFAWPGGIAAIIVYAARALKLEIIQRFIRRLEWEYCLM